jgi:hypothetical protein
MKMIINKIENEDQKLLDDVIEITEIEKLGDRIHLSYKGDHLEMDDENCSDIVLSYLPYWLNNNDINGCTITLYNDDGTENNEWSVY